MYAAHKSDLATEKGYVYEKMMIALAAGYATDRISTTLAFNSPPMNYDYMERFNIFKDLYDQNKLMRYTQNRLSNGTFIQNDWFSDYHVQLYRMFMVTDLRNEDIIWMNGYSHEKNTMSWGIPYLHPNYNQAKLYAEANRQLYDDKYLLTKYNIPYNDGVPRLWMALEAGGICWGQGRFGQAMQHAQGIPAVGAYSSGHEFYFHYYRNDDGNAYWQIENGYWTGSGSTWYGGNRFRYLFDWGNKPFVTQYIPTALPTSTGYLPLAQENLNRYENYKKSLYYNLITNSYEDDKKIEGLLKSLEVNDINLDTYDYLINAYKRNSINNGGTITSEDWYHMAKKLVVAYRLFPTPLYDLLNLIRPYLNTTHRLEIDQAQKEAYEYGVNATVNDTIHYASTRSHAGMLLGRAQPDPFSFSFDGENAGKLIQSELYPIAWRFSLDGGKTYIAMRDGKRVKVKESENNIDYIMDQEFTLTEEELASITDENDIIFGFMGMPSFKFRLDISTGTIDEVSYFNDFPEQKKYLLNANDLEN